MPENPAIAQRTNAVIVATLVLLHGATLFLLPALLMRSLFWALLLVPLALINIVHWGLIHEAIHKLLFRSARRNEFGGRILAILMGPSFHVLRFGHLMHHKMNRDWHAETVASPTLTARLGHYYNLFCGLYLSEMYTSLALALLPRRRFMAMARATFLKPYEAVAVAGERFFYERGNVRHLRIDLALGTALYAGAFYDFGPAWPVLLAFLALRAMVISFMDNIYHHATPLDNSKAGKELVLPGAVSALMLHGNYHETHHLNPDIPWACLPAVHAAQDRPFDGAFLDHGMRQFRLSLRPHA